MLIVAAGLIAALIIGDVIEVAWHPDRLAQVPSRVVDTVANQEQLRQLGAVAQNWLARAVAVGLPKVAGSKDAPADSPEPEKTPTPTPTAAQPIPLKF